MRRMAPGPGNWIVASDFANLAQLGMGQDMRMLDCVAEASKIRIAMTIAKDAHAKHLILAEDKAIQFHRPFGE